MSRIDKDGRDVTHLPGLWSEDDRQMMNADNAMEFLDKNGGYPEYEDWCEEVKPAISILAAEVKRLREELAEANKTLDFFYGQLQMHSPKMDGEHGWRFKGGWPMTHCVGPTPEIAVQRAIKEAGRFKSLAGMVVQDEP